MDPSLVGRVAVTFAIVVGSLGFVLWRQSRSFEAYVALDDLRREVAVAQAERIELERSIQVLLSRGRVVPAAIERLGMHMPDGSEQIILPGEATS
jgi:hypothetical protein